MREGEFLKQRWSFISLIDFLAQKGGSPKAQNQNFVSHFQECPSHKKVQYSKHSEN